MTSELESYRSDPMGIKAKGYRFVVRGDDAFWCAPWRVLPNDVDVTDINDTDELATIFEREKQKAANLRVAVEDATYRARCEKAEREYYDKNPLTLECFCKYQDKMCVDCEYDLENQKI